MVQEGTIRCCGMTIKILTCQRLTVQEVINTENYRDLQQNYGAYNFITELEIRTVRVLSRPYNQGTYGRCDGMARRPLTV